MGKRRLIFMMIMLLTLLSACNHREQSKKESAQAPERGEVSGDQQEELEPTFTFPLTGLGTENEPNNRSIAVMINNHPKARPQSGLSKADIIFEALAEGEITRFLAIFQSEKPDKIGPVRSARDYFIDLAKGYNSLYVAHGYSPEAYTMLENGYIDHINGMQYDGTLFERTSDRQAPHNSYITYDNILKGAELRDINMDFAPHPLEFATNDEIQQIYGEEINQIDITYSKSNVFNVKYEYNNEIKKLLRYSDDEQTIDEDSNEPVLIDNLIIVEMEHHIIDNEGRRDINVTSGGKAYIVQNGMYREIAWNNIEGEIIPYENGEPIKLLPGKTWINIVPSLSDVSLKNM
ncbi:DUF3048 domain-containing protein [Heyndrickxia oleronia]|uniref:DUF3048 domain-containing protein n=2 Tax=Bacillaceae TaxID=186817 RepID=UPI001C0F1B0E|nr:DUF3048 domain-containing protein [Heyndrickxia oleronia]MBU5213865.1 DUF3048 domain-containing protein [Heyndrickxia oleronia]MCI1589847.1 DUF3048 domain-containing protein [Heyndrickxia oleronia]MCI1613445.1 DUF3048 domain-containing protein [Heyndrickxia oleronia]MCI1744440.1 DUF3048 domain-containing protein [Heyndrickxia oleronia]MCI1763767.1 DUF3048 domain-containing protein [Heyndrickxia oleronia]